MTTMTKFILIIIATATVNNVANAGVSEEVLNSIQTPNEVETSIGVLKFKDGAPVICYQGTVYPFQVSS